MFIGALRPCDKLRTLSPCGRWKRVRRSACERETKKAAGTMSPPRLSVQPGSADRTDQPDRWLLRCLDELVGVGLRQVDLSVLDLRRRLAEHVKDRLRALWV